MKESGEITLDRTLAHIKLMEISKGARITNPIVYFTKEVAKLEEELDLLKNGKGTIPEEMSREGVIEWHLGVLENQKKYLACCQEMPLRLTIDNYHAEIIDLVEEGVIPVESRIFLTGIVDSYIQKDELVVATERRIQMAKNYLQRGVIFNDHMDFLFDVMVIIPENKEMKSFFAFVKKYPGRELKYLKDA